jgi:hypothetical protein
VVAGPGEDGEIIHSRTVRRPSKCDELTPEEWARLAGHMGTSGPELGTGTSPVNTTIPSTIYFYLFKFLPSYVPFLAVHHAAIGKRVAKYSRRILMPFFLLVKFSCSDLKKGISIFPLA